jgi:LysR family glycine cleavage system transcriptional activator
MAAPSHLKSFQALELAARTGSFSAAAELLAITPAAVGQRVKALEDYLGVPLLERGRAGIRPTSALLQALPDLRAGFAALEDAATALDLQRAQDLHIAAVPDFVDLWLKPRLGRFHSRHPNVRFRINGDGDAPMRIARVDCEINFTLPGSSDSEDLLFPDFLMPIASPDMIRRMGSLDAATRLEGFPLLHLDFYREDADALTWPRWCVANTISRHAPERGMRFQRVRAALNAVAADAGVALCGVALLSEAIADGKALPAYPVAMGEATTHAFCARYRRPVSPSRLIGAFRAWLQEEARATRTWVEGLKRGDEPTGK